MFLGRPKQTLEYAQKAMRLDPRHPAGYWNEEGFAYILIGQNVEAIDALKKGDQSNPWVHAELAYAYSELVREQDAGAEAREVLRVSPGFTLQQVKQRMPGNWQSAEAQHYLAGLRKAGLN